MLRLGLESLKDLSARNRRVRIDSRPDLAFQLPPSLEKLQGII
jgi:hypothetical protein